MVCATAQWLRAAQRSIVKAALGFRARRRLAGPWQYLFMATDADCGITSRSARARAFILRQSARTTRLNLADAPTQIISILANRSAALRAALARRRDERAREPWQPRKANAAEPSSAGPRSTKPTVPPRSCTPNAPPPTARPRASSATPSGWCGRTASWARSGVRRRVHRRSPAPCLAHGRSGGVDRRSERHPAHPRARAGARKACRQRETRWVPPAPAVTSSS